MLDPASFEIDGLGSSPWRPDMSMITQLCSISAIGTARDSIPFYPWAVIVRKAETLSVWGCHSASMLHIFLD